MSLDHSAVAKFPKEDTRRVFTIVTGVVPTQASIVSDRTIRYGDMRPEAS